ncbi:MAG TPA: single-stranded-DNA-specific exonuclease RecJ [Balneolales bacterium]|nr:single-stranded-DNA-specific exonuclease RecJ [Balneolales bacterium]
MSFRWVFAQPEDEDAVSLLRKELGVPDIIARLLAIRGISTFETARSFFRPNIKDIYDPFLMKDMDKASCRVAKAVREGEKVVVYGDYDVDGTTATSIMYTFLKDFGCDVEYYIPHRFKEGYGVSPEGIDYAEEIGAGLIISVDCGITAFEESLYAKEKAIDMVICDHHTVGETIPDALAVLDPKRPDCKYPFDGLSGAGVAFKLIQATLMKLGLQKEVAYKFLDLVAVSIASDIVPIIDENRILMREGLKILNTNPRPGIKALMNLINLHPGKIGTSQIVFSIGPRINAAGRLGDATTAVELQIAETDEEANARAHELEAINIRRRQIDSDTMEKAMAILDNEFDMDNDSSVVLHNPEWHLGVIGIVASRLVDKYCRPTIMLSTVDGMVKGSARSIKGFNIYNALKKCDDLLVQFGGHEYAAGLTLMADQLDLFRERFNNIVLEQLDDEDFKPELIIDTELDLSKVDARFWKVLRQFEPYGPQNLKPIFVSHGLRVIGTPTIVGNGHLKLRVTQNGSAVFEAIGFNMHEFLPLVRTCKNGELNMAYVLEENTWNHRTTLQMRIKDIQIDSD